LTRQQFDARLTMNKTILGTVLVLVCGFCASTKLLAQQTPLTQTSSPWQKQLDRGLRVTGVHPNSPAATAGIRPMDVITKYGDFDIVDDAGFYAAKDHYEQAGRPIVEIVVWRVGYRWTANVRSGWLGIDAVDNDQVSEAFWKYMTRINTMRSLAEYMHDREFRGQFLEPPASILADANALLDSAERQGKLTSAQLQLYRIYMILDEASPEEQIRQAELLENFIATQPLSYVNFVGYERFFKDKRYRAAIPCFLEYLKTSPDDVNVRLNLGFAYWHVSMYKEAIRAVDYVFDHNLSLSDYGRNVAYTVKAGAALGLKDYKNSVKFGQVAFELQPKFYTISMVQLAAAQMGDVTTVDNCTQLFRDTLPARYADFKLQIEAVRAYALTKANRRAEAIQVVQGWRNLDIAHGRVVGYWRGVPDGMDVANNWADLMKN
jgi:tetratricopeptide (TPR) repeat protein